MIALPTSAAQPVSLDRDAGSRESARLWDEIDAHPDSRVVLAGVGVIAMHEGDLAWMHPSAAPAGERIYLGRALNVPGLAPGSPLELRLLPPAAEPGAELSDPHFGWTPLRQALIAQSSTEIALTAVALANWRAGTRHCPRCGTGLEAAQAGWSLRCTACALQVFPRTDPAVIVRVVDANGRVLLGSNALWEQNRYSLLAGFVEPGETLEAAVIREIAEESGLTVTKPRYLASQPWPFPASLMLGFEATATTTEVQPDGVEILQLRWCDRSDITDARMLLPGAGSLARFLLEEWYGAPLPESTPTA